MAEVLKQEKAGPFAQNVALIAAGYRAMLDILPEEDKAAVARLHLELMNCLVGNGDARDIQDILDTIEEIVESRPITATMEDLSARRQSAEMRNWLRFVGATIKRLRKAAKLTQEELAERCGLPQPHISRLENAEHSPSRKTLEKLGAALGVNVEEFEIGE
jgi:ribosome-binding protein aMBF1 (putative translation factor)